MNAKVSAIIITYNEATAIERCIDSLLPVANEIIVVDSFSTDNTKYICLSLAKQHNNLRFFQRDFTGYSNQKNWGIAQAKHPYILSLDADECLTPTLTAAIKIALKKSDYKAYQFNRLTWYCGKWIKHGHWYPDRKLRLWHKKYGSWNTRPIHESVQLKAHTKIAHLKGNLLHYAFISEQEHLQQIAKYTTISANMLYQQGKKANFYHIYLKPIWKFISGYLFKAGFLDGKQGYAVAKHSAYATYLKYTKLKNISK